jgi:ubiquitin carboxyl-terminal hydrolase 14
MRKVKFPLQLDALDIATDELREKLAPVNAEVKQILKTRDDRAKIAKRAKGKNAPSDEKTEEEHREEEHKKAAELIEQAGGAAAGTSPSGMYELCGE